MNKTCSNCEHWDRLTYSKVKYGVCYQPDDKGDDGLSVSVEVDDDCGLRVELRTGPNFGCTKFEPKERSVSCCSNEKRNMNGGCDNCGDPCL